MISKLLTIIAVFQVILCYGQNLKGKVVDAQTLEPLKGIKIQSIAKGVKAVTNRSGEFKLPKSQNKKQTIIVDMEQYCFEEFVDVDTNSELTIKLRERKESAATKRWKKYMESCENYKDVNIPDDQTWNLSFVETELEGDLKPDPKFIRRDPSKVIKVDDLYYVWYSFTKTSVSTYFKTDDPKDRVFPWDYCDVYYATSKDGHTWEEKGLAVGRGKTGAFDDRSVFTPEIFVHKNKYYLVYQAVKSPYIQRVKNTVAMAVSDSPNGPWKKLDAPILKPANNGVWKKGTNSRFEAVEKGDFDSHKVHDPCLIYFKDKFYLYYKGERMGEEKFCGQREIRWGVAISDNPEGPYEKSVYNPITNTGHEVSVWPYNNGIAIIQKLDGPEIGSIQFAEDGINFEMKGKASHVPDALGLANIGEQENSPSGGVKWGLAHELHWDNDNNGNWMNLSRFDIVDEKIRTIIFEKETLTIEKGSSIQLDFKIYPQTAADKKVVYKSSDMSKVVVSEEGEIKGVSKGESNIEVCSKNGKVESTIKVIVQ